MAIANDRITDSQDITISQETAVHMVAIMMHSIRAVHITK
jgi:hypothetical protein